MEEKIRCTKEATFGRMESDLKTLFREVDKMAKRVEANANMGETINSLDKNLAVQTQMLTYIVEHNQKQDARMDKQAERMDRQDEINAEQHQVMAQISQNLTELNHTQQNFSIKMEEMEATQILNEERQTIHTGELFRNLVLKIALPIGLIGGLLYQIIKILMNQ